MAIIQYWIGTTGPFFFDSALLYADGESVRAFRAEAVEGSDVVQELHRRINTGIGRDIWTKISPGLIGLQQINDALINNTLNELASLFSDRLQLDDDNKQGIFSFNGITFEEKATGKTFEVNWDAVNSTWRLLINGVEVLSGDTAAIQQSFVDAKGDLLAGTGDDVIARLPVGVDTDFLVCDSAQATGLKWQTANTAFNKNFGTTAGSVAEGNDSRINNGQTAFGWGNHATAGYASAGHNHDTVYEPIDPLNGVTQLGMTVSNPPTQAEVQSIADKVDEIIAALS